MGAAQSSNAAQAVANVSNFVTNSTTANTTQVNSIENLIKLDNCLIKLNGDFDVKTSSILAQTNNQIIAAKQDSNLNNNIQQQMLQQAESTVGSLGIGYADASNSASEMVNDTNQVVNAMTVGCNQYSTVNNNFTCSGSTIIAKNMNIGFNTVSEFLSTQTLNNDQVTNIVNDISQSITQKATATVEGISGILILILLMIAAIVYVLMKPLSSGSVKIIIGVVLCFVIVGIMILMFLRASPPFFSDPQECIAHSSIGKGGSDSGTPADCVDLQPKKITLAHPPLKYIYGIMPGNSSQPGGNLVQMAVSSVNQFNSDSGAGPNGGYTVKAYNELNNRLSSTDSDAGTNYISYANTLGVRMIPNPLIAPTNSSGLYYAIPIQYIPGNSGDGKDQSAMCTPGTIQVGVATDAQDLGTCPSVASPTLLGTTEVPDAAIANLNLQVWLDYMNVTGSQPNIGPNDTSDNRALFARFVLCDIIGNIDLHHYVKPNELVKFIADDNSVKVSQAIIDGKEGGQPMYPNDTYLYHPYSFPGSWANGVIGPGYIMGQVGVCNTNTYKFEKFMRNIGGYILIGILGLFFCFIGYTEYKKKKGGSMVSLAESPPGDIELTTIKK